MPDKTPAQLKALKSGYLVYRRLMTGPLAGKFGRMSMDMIVAANAIESKLAVRGKVAPTAFPSAAEDMYAELFDPESRVAPNKLIDLAKAAQRPENFNKAKAALTTFLARAHGGGGAPDLKEELELLAGHFVTNCFGVKWIPGPLKKLKKALGKTREDYGWAYGQNKDLVRGTLACESQATLKAIATLVTKTCTNEFAMRLIKQDEQKAKADGGTSVTGYSGWNFVVLFREHPSFGAEIQANTFAVLYGKMAKKEFCEQLGVTEQKYLARQHQLKFPGGLGHTLYDIQDARTLSTKEEKDTARALACDYNDGCREQFRGDMTLRKLNDAIMSFGATLTSIEAKAHWKHGVEGCGWAPLQQQLAKPAQAVEKPRWKSPGR
jgi:hypothetical protein